MYRDNPLKAKLRAGQPAIGYWAELTDPMAVELMALAGYDAVILDHEHGAGSLQNAMAQLHALSALPMAGLLRVPWNDPVAIKRVLDLGIEGLVVPSVNSAEEAAAVVRACRYPPAGIRGCAVPFARATDYGLRRDTYPQSIDDRLMIVCQIETPQAVEAIPDIAAVEGVDMLFVGAFDLSASVGKMGRWDDAQVRQLISRAERDIRDSGRWLGAIGSLGRSVAEMVRDGCHFVTASTDTLLLRDAAMAELAAFRGAASPS